MSENEEEERKLEREITMEERQEGEKKERRNLEGIRFWDQSECVCLVTPITLGTTMKT